MEDACVAKLDLTQKLMSVQRSVVSACCGDSLSCCTAPGVGLFNDTLHAGAAGKPVSVLFAGNSAEALQDPAVVQLSAWGYPVPACVEALHRLKGHPDAAHQDLFARLAGTSPFCVLTCTMLLVIGQGLFQDHQLHTQLADAVIWLCM